MTRRSNQANQANQASRGMRGRGLIWVAAVGIAGCAPEPKPVARPRPIDPERNSGADAKRSGARMILPNRIITDGVDGPRGDRTDWASVELAGKPGILTVLLQWEEAASEVDVDVYDGFGALIAKSPEAKGQVKTLAVDIPGPGTYYLRIQSHTPEDAARYSLETKWAGDELIPLPVTPDKAKERPRDPTRPSTPIAQPTEFEGDVQGRIVSARREGEGTILHIDKGASAGVKVGNRGAILDGPVGVTALPSGGFTITEVVDDARSIAKSKVKTVGHNTRVSIKTSGK